MGPLDLKGVLAAAAEDQRQLAEQNRIAGGVLYALAQLPPAQLVELAGNLGSEVNEQLSVISISVRQVGSPIVFKLPLPVAWLLAQAEALQALLVERGQVAGE